MGINSGTPDRVGVLAVPEKRLEQTVLLSYLAESKWCARRDSNARPSDPESDALSRLSYGRTGWGERGDLNPRPPEPQSGALTN
jgi:hypothetical protein